MCTGTATAFHLLANLLKQQPNLKVTFLGATKDTDTCTQAQKVQYQSGTTPCAKSHATLLSHPTGSKLHLTLRLGMQVHVANGLDFECLQERHFEAPKVVETYPYEALSVTNRCTYRLSTCTIFRHFRHHAS